MAVDNPVPGKAIEGFGDFPEILHTSSVVAAEI